MPASSYPLSTIHYPLLAWHGLSLPLPDDWSPVKIEGDAAKGAILIADLHATRLAIRWQTVRRPDRFDADAWSKRALNAEVGQLMLEKATTLDPDAGDGWVGGRLFLEPEPPGRDVWVGFHRPSGRAVEIVHQTKNRTRTLPELIVRPLRVVAGEWSIFDLSCRVPDGWTLQRQRLNAGDLTLTFGKRRGGALRGTDTLIVRQLGPAALALARQPIERWLDQHAKLWTKRYAGRAPADVEPDGLVRTYDRRRRFFFARWLERQRVIVAAHDRERDRVVIVDASTRELALETLATVGASST